MYTLNLSKPCNVYFIGIGGISMSGLAKILKKEGFTVSGSDRNLSEEVKELISLGIHVNIGHAAENISSDFDVVVYTAAISNDNPEYNAALSLGIKTISRAELLGAIMDNYNNSITVAGTHGKTTTTSMLSLILLEYTDPTVTIGGILPAISSNVHLGDSDIFVAEACEYTNSFYSFRSKYSVILNIEEDHPDFFKDLADIRHSFHHFSKNVTDGGTLFLNSEIDDLEDFTSDLTSEIFTFGLSPESDLYAKDIKTQKGKSTFIPVYKGKELDPIELMVPGLFNIINALGAISVSIKMDVPYSAIKSGLYKFHGAHRRMEYKGNYNGALIYDDYAHHPTEIKSTLIAAREYEAKRLIVVFQPHTYTRTKAYLDDFIDALSLCDLSVLCEIYPAREENVYNLSSEIITKSLVNKGFDSLYFSTLEDAEKFFEKNLMNGDLLITMGAGDVYIIGNRLLGL